MSKLTNICVHFLFLQLTDMEMNSQAENKAQSSKDLHTTESTTDNMEVFEVDLTSLLSQAKPLEHSTPRQTQSNIEKGKGSTNKQKGQKNVSLHQKKQEVIDVSIFGKCKMLSYIIKI